MSVGYVADNLSTKSRKAWGRCWGGGGQKSVCHNLGRETALDINTPQGFYGLSCNAGVGG